MSTKPNIQEIIEKIDKLPEINNVAVKIIRMLDDKDTRVKDLSEIISLDQSLTVQLLKVCNSAYFGFSQKITSINDAVVKLGFKAVKNLTFMAITHTAFKREVPGYKLESGEIWNNSVTCAVYAKHIAKKASYSDPETAFTAGLLRDIGKLVIHEYIGTTYSEIVKKVYIDGVSFSEAEEAILGFNHSYIGSQLAKNWNLPKVLVDAIKYHHNFNGALENNCEDIKLVAIVHIADALTMMTGSGVGNDGLMYNIDKKALEHINVPQDASGVEKLFSEVFELKPEIEKTLGLIDKE